MEFKVHVNTLIRNKNNSFLFVKEKKAKIYGKLNLPGGHLEFNESIVQCAHREVMEETGLTVALNGLVSITSTVAESFHAVGFVFAADCITEEITISCPDIIECVWLTGDEIKTLSDDVFVNPVKIKSAIENRNKGQVMYFDGMDTLIKKY